MTKAVEVLVVGGGSAGCVVAARMAGSGRSVVLVEAGPDLRGRAPEALRAGWDIAPRELGWGYESLPNPRGNTQNVWRTKALGGTSWLTRFAVRGAPGDFETWGPEWSWDQVLPWFKRIEADRDFGGDQWHGADGPMPVDRYLSREFQPATVAVLQAIAEAGFPLVDDHNRPGAVGVGRMPMSLIGDERVTTVDAYLARDAAPPGLTVRCETQVARIVFEGDVARGVETVDGDTVDARQVVLCAGVYGNPPLLMRSGIGPAGDLRGLGIDVRSDLPEVGANLADHPAVTIETPIAGTEAGVLHSIATFHSSSTEPAQPPDLMLWVADPDDDKFFGADVVLLLPRSRGSVRLRSADPSEPPVIELPALSDQADRVRLLEGFEAAARILGADAVRRHLAAAPPTTPDHEALLEQILDEAYSLPHVVGTCAMGTVVDAFGNLHGVENVTIADASIIPNPPSGFTHYPTIMLAERIADHLAQVL